MIPVDIAPDVQEVLRRMKDGGTVHPRCHDGVIRSAVGGQVRRLLAGELDGAVRPWDLPALTQRGPGLGAVTGARIVVLDAGVLVAELLPDGERIVFRGVDDSWRLVRFADGDYRLRPETSRRVVLRGDGPDAVLEALGLVKPDGVDSEYAIEDLGQGETESRRRYQWTDGSRSVLAEEVTTEIFDGATPRSSYVRGVIIDGDRGTVLTGGDGSAVITEG